jgi:crotonobetainyl-CoA:carnitine CoA-transferase CaiB-like acyl-CoA transferase
MSNAASPPDGLVALDFIHTLAGPYCKMLMATSGAKVVEIARRSAAPGVRGFRARVPVR